ncbi:MAG: YcbK family protein [Gammaproteobacteria bacterium]
MSRPLKSRRKLIAGFSGALAASMLTPFSAAAAVNSAPRKTLTFVHLHTGEKLESTYWADNSYHRPALDSIDHLLRDFRTGDVHPIETGLLDILHRVKLELNIDAPFHVIGGYRSPKTNDMLRKKSTGVAKRSLHMQGRAIDVRVPDLKSSLLREVAADLKLGGVGYYRSSNFVHLDTGRPRVW